MSAAKRTKMIIVTAGLATPGLLSFAATAAANAPAAIEQSQLVPGTLQSDPFAHAQRRLMQELGRLSALEKIDLGAGRITEIRPETRSKIIEARKCTVTIHECTAETEGCTSATMCPNGNTGARRSKGKKG
jgi:hypothetical protein